MHNIYNNLIFNVLQPTQIALHKTFARRKTLYSTAVFQNLHLGYLNEVLQIILQCQLKDLQPTYVSTSLNKAL